ncbi:MAG: ABC transporter substrate-binding protein [Negativicutes bacterium]
MNLTKRVISSILFSIMVLGVVGCTPATTPPAKTPPAATAPKYKDTLIIANAIDITSVDKMENSTVVGNQIWDMVFDGVMTIDPKTKAVVPRLAEKVDKVSPTEYVFTLRKGVKFHDGTVLKASDVKYTLERMKTMPAVATNVASIKEIIIPDDNTVRILLKAPSEVFLEQLAQTGGGIISKAAIEKAGKYVPIGTGPYKFVEWVPSTRITVEKFDDCWDKGAVTKRITMRIMPEGAARVIALEKGEIDVVLEPAAIDLGHIKSNNNTKLLQIPSCKLDYFSFNMQKAPFNNLLVRQAMAHAVNRKEIITAVLEGNGIPAHNVVGAGTWSYTDDLKGYEFDLAKAKALMAQAGFANGFNMTVTLNGDVRERVAQVLQAQFGELKIKLTINNLDNATHRGLINSGKYDSSVSAWSNPGDPDIILRNMFHSALVGVNNRTHMANPAIDKQIDAAVVEGDRTKRLALYKSLQQEILTTAGMIPLYYETLNVGVRKNVENVYLNAGGTHWYKYAFVLQ